MDYAEETVVVATMGYKHENLISKHTGESLTVDKAAIVKKLGKTQINLKLIPDVDGTPAIAQLVAYNLVDIELKGAWEGPARLHMVPHVNAPVADLPVKKVRGGVHMIADLTLPFGRVIYDYLADNDVLAIKNKSGQVG
jgi:acetoacetate decarboxylase